MEDMERVMMPEVDDVVMRCVYGYRRLFSHTSAHMPTITLTTYLAFSLSTR